MSDANGHGRGRGAGKDPGVLVNLPSTRPQRATPRRAAARRDAEAARAAGDVHEGAGPPEGAGARATGNGSSGRAHVPHAKRPTRERNGTAGPGGERRGMGRERAPRQGFESEGEAMTGSVRPPGALELAASAAELVGELAKAGLSTGERLVRDIFSRLPR